MLAFQGAAIVLLEDGRRAFVIGVHKLAVNAVKYPIKELDYKTNIYNEKARSFYEKRGCIIKETAFELQKMHINKDLMTSKYCIKNQLGLCSKLNKPVKYKEPYTLIDEFNKEYLVEFNCSDCIMKIKSLN